MTKAHIKDGRLILEGPGIFQVSSPVDETIEVEDGKSRTRKLPTDPTPEAEVEYHEDGLSVTVALVHTADGEEPEVDEEESPVKVYRRVLDRHGKVLYRDAGPVKFEKKEPVEHQAGIGLAVKPITEEEAD